MNDSFIFNAANAAKAKEVVQRYPEKRSAIMPLLYLVQDQTGGWIPSIAMTYLSKFLDVPEIYIREVASFYTMFYTEKVGKFIISVCRTTPCWLCGSDDILSTCKEYLNLETGQTSEDGKFTLTEFECLGNCTNAPIMQVNGKFYENMTKEKVIELLEGLR